MGVHIWRCVGQEASHLWDSGMGISSVMGMHPELALSMVHVACVSSWVWTMMGVVSIGLALGTCHMHSKPAIGMEVAVGMVHVVHVSSWMCWVSCL